MLNVYETLSRFKSSNVLLREVNPLTYSNEFYHNDFGGYKLTDGAVYHYLIHYMEFDPDWKLYTGYDKPLDSEAFFIPVRFVERAVMETEPTTLVFVVGKNIMYI